MSNKWLALDFDLVITLRLMEYDEKTRFDSLKAIAAMQGIEVNDEEPNHQTTGKITKETQYW